MKIESFSTTLHSLQAMKRVGDLAFDTLYGAFGWQELEGTAHEIFRESMKRYDCI